MKDQRERERGEGRERGRERETGGGARQWDRPTERYGETDTERQREIDKD